MSKYRKYKLKLKKILHSKGYTNYYDCVLTQLGLSPFFIRYNNYCYFGPADLSDQTIIHDKFSHIIKKFEEFLNYLYKKYSVSTLVLELGIVYSKLQEIHLKNDEILGKYIFNDNILEVSYPAKAADIMARKIKNITELVILKDNHRFDFGLSNKDYKKIIMLLYYYSLFIFYNSKSKLSGECIDAPTEFRIFPSSIDPIATIILEQDNSNNENLLHFNYNPNFDSIDSNFNETFLNEKGIKCGDYVKLLDDLSASLKKKDMLNGRLKKDVLFDILKRDYPYTDIEKFQKECILTNGSFESNENELYKNNCKHRLDTTPIISIDDNYLLLNYGFIWNCSNFWKNVYSIGLTPYVTKDGDALLKSVDKIVEKISIAFQKDIVKLLKQINNHFIIYENKHTNDIFKKASLPENEWDIIAINHYKKLIFNIESKFFTTSMTESGLANDLKKMIKDNKNSYKNKFEKRVRIVEDNIEEFNAFCKSNNEYVIENIMVTSKVIDLNIISKTRRFKIVHFDGLKKFLDNYYN